jgi:hypothetical protein
VCFPWDEYQLRLATWDEISKCIGLAGEFYEGREVLLYPPDWLDRSARLAIALRGTPRKAKGIGIDPAEGGDKTAMAAVDEFGLIELLSKKTPNTAIITSEALAFMRRHNVPPENVCIDRGGGGKQHADRLKQMGYEVRTVAFGEPLIPKPRHGKHGLHERVAQRESRYAYINRRAEMYGRLRELLDPSFYSFGESAGRLSSSGFAIPGGSLPVYMELRRQLAPIPLLYDPEGRLFLPPKTKRNPKSTIKTLTEIIGHSPDEADALVLAIHAMSTETKRKKAGAMV